MVDQLYNTGRGSFIACIPSLLSLMRRFTSNYRLLIIPAKFCMAEVTIRNASKLFIGIIVSWAAKLFVCFIIWSLVSK